MSCQRRWAQVTLDRVEGRKVFLQGGVNIWDGRILRDVDVFFFGADWQLFFVNYVCHLGISGMNMMCFLLSKPKPIYLNGAISDGVFFNMKGETLHFVVCRCWAPSKDLYLTRTA